MAKLELTSTEASILLGLLVMEGECIEELGDPEDSKVEGLKDRIIDFIEKEDEPKKFIPGKTQVINLMNNLTTWWNYSKNHEDRTRLYYLRIEHSLNREGLGDKTVGELISMLKQEETI